MRGHAVDTLLAELTHLQQRKAWTEREIKKAEEALDRLRGERSQWTQAVYDIEQTLHEAAVAIPGPPTSPSA